MEYLTPTNRCESMLESEPTVNICQSGVGSSMGKR